MAFIIPEEVIRDVQHASDIVDVISDFVLLKKAGKNFIGLCPFHTEKTPSFTVSPDKQIYYCFGCGAGGNVFSFLTKREGYSFPEAVKMLAGRYGIQIPERELTPDQQRQKSERERLFEINKLAADIFIRNLNHAPARTSAKDYLNNRGTNADTLTNFSLGYALDGWDYLLKDFNQQKIPPEMAEKAGLVVPRSNGSGFYDRFRNRIMFPIMDLHQRIIGFGGRVMDDSLPKYLNTPETLLYSKSRSLYGLNVTRQKCRDKGAVYLVEGYFDLLSLYQHGIQNVVATLGTALTVEHVRILKGIANRMILVFDSDDAGVKAAERSIDVFRKEDVDAQILILPSGYDPDTFVFRFGADAFTSASEQAKGIISFLIESAINKHGLSVEGKIKILSDMKSPLLSIQDPLARHLYIRELAERIAIEESSVLEKLKETQSLQIHRSSENRGYIEDRFESKIIEMMLQYPEIISEISDRNLLDYFENDTFKSIGYTVVARKETAMHGVSDIITQMEDEKIQRIAASLAIGEDNWNRDGCLKLISQFQDSRMRRNKTLLKQIKEAEEGENQEVLFELLKKRQIQAMRNN